MYPVSNIIIFHFMTNGQKDETDMRVTWNGLNGLINGKTLENIKIKEQSNNIRRANENIYGETDKDRKLTKSEHETGQKEYVFIFVSCPLYVRFFLEQPASRLEVKTDITQH
jgi:hypothetical protein